MLQGAFNIGNGQLTYQGLYVLVSKALYRTHVEGKLKSEIIYVGACQGGQGSLHQRARSCTECTWALPQHLLLLKSCPREQGLPGVLTLLLPVQVLPREQGLLGVGAGLARLHSAYRLYKASHVHQLRNYSHMIWHLAGP